MTRTPFRRAAACLAAGVMTSLLTLSAPAAHAATPAADQTPLSVTIDTLTPSTVPTSGRVTITGRVTNTSKQKWSGLQVSMLTSRQPITSESALAAASASDAAAPIGERLLTPGLYEDIGDLAPGKSSAYHLSIPRSQLRISGRPGVYWFGVHVLGADAAGFRDAVADGRARTFVPLVPPQSSPTRLAVAMPLQDRVRRDRYGRLLDVRHWRRTFGPDGRLERLLRLSATAENRPLTWIVDPAVVDAARSMARQNPVLDIGPTEQPSGGGAQSPSPSPSPSATPSTTAGPSASANATTSPPSPLLTGSALDARTWVQLLQQQAASHTVMTLPYGDLDVASALRHHRSRLLKDGKDLSAETMADLGVAASPVVAPDPGYLPDVALRRLGSDAPVLLRETAFPSASGTVLVSPRGGSVVLADTAAAAGGPDPTDRFSALAVRQRILSEAALHSLSSQRDRPLVVTTPRQWDPGPGWEHADFFSGLDASWVDLMDVPSVVASGSGGGTAHQRAYYPRAVARHEVPTANLLANHQLSRLGDTFAGVLTRNTTVDEDVAKIAALGSGETARAHPNAALRRVRSTARYVRSQMEKVQVEGPPFVTMSSNRGPIQVTLVNGLDQEVTVAVRARTRSPDVTVTGSDPVTLGPGSRASVRLTARAGDIGVHSVTLMATDAAGNPLGSTATFNVRTSQVGLVIWVILAIGGAVLVVAIAVRLVRRVRPRTLSKRPRLPGESS